MPPPEPRAATPRSSSGACGIGPVAVLGARDILNVFNHQAVFGFSVDENRGCIIHERGFPRQTESHRKSPSEGARQLRTRTRDPTVVSGPSAYQPPRELGGRRLARDRRLDDRDSSFNRTRGSGRLAAEGAHRAAWRRRRAPTGRRWPAGLRAPNEVQARRSRACRGSLAAGRGAASSRPSFSCQWRVEIAQK